MLFLFVKICIQVEQTPMSAIQKLEDDLVVDVEGTMFAGDLSTTCLSLELMGFLL